MEKHSFSTPATPLTSQSNPIAFIVTGGTGGHVFPAKALTVELKKRHIDVHVFSDKRGYKLFTPAEISAHAPTIISSEQLKGKWYQKLATCFKILWGTLCSLRAIQKYQPKIVIGFGGYSSIPVLLAARLYGLPVILHEQNAYMGRANRWLAQYAHIIGISFKTTQGIPENLKAKIVLTGSPVRAEILPFHGTSYISPIATKRFNVLVLGGSQGAKIFSEVVPAALLRLPLQLRRSIYLTMQVHASETRDLRKILEENQIHAEVSHFFQDIPNLLNESHLVISRAGASTLTEISAVGRPAILIPYPYAADNHQHLNARDFCKHEAGWLITQEAFTPQSLANRLEALFTLPITLEKAAAASHKYCKIHATENLADLVIENIYSFKQKNALFSRLKSLFS